jgi:hypothetical protein
MKIVRGYYAVKTIKQETNEMTKGEGMLETG